MSFRWLLEILVEFKYVPLYFKQIYSNSFDSCDSIKFHREFKFPICFLTISMWPHYLLTLTLIFNSDLGLHRWLQWPRGLRHELSSSAQTLRLWVRIPLKTCSMFVCVYSEFVLSCVGSGLVSGWSPVQGVLTTVWVKRSVSRMPYGPKWKKQE
jgi:hypothetical protein